MAEPESPPPSYEDLDDPFVVNPAAPVPTPPQPTPTQPYGAQPSAANYRALYGYGPEIPAPEDFVQPTSPAEDGKWFMVSVGKEIVITGSWAVAADKVHRVPCCVWKGYATWNRAIQQYTKLYRSGLVKVVQPKPEPHDDSTTPAGNTSTPITVHSAAPTPVHGDRFLPIHVQSSPVAAPLTPGRNTSITVQTTTAITVHTPAPTPTQGDRALPIHIQSSPLVTTTPPVNSGGVASPIYVFSSPAAPIIAPPAKQDKQLDAATIKRHRYFEKAFAKMEEAKTPTKAGPSQPAAWLNPMPVSIPGAAKLASLSKITTTPNVQPSTPLNNASTASSSGKGKKEYVVEVIDSDSSDDEYFRDMSPLTDETLEKVWELEQTMELQQALSSPRFE